MKRLSVLVAAVLIVVVAAARSRQQIPISAEPLAKVEERNPWTNLRFNNDSAEFRFAIVSDRTGGHRARVFSQAVDQLNLMQPEFVLSVGDLIEGYNREIDQLATQWKEFQGYVNKLQMPFFYVPGNHDLANVVEDGVWKEKFGRRYYSFIYRNVLFLILCSDDPPDSGGHITDEQVAWAKKTLDENKDVRWTIVALHKPLWAQANLPLNGWLAVEKLLTDRPYTVYAGHIHHYQKFVRQGRNYYQLATTGGGSRLRGVPYGEFDQIAWVTMKKDGPVMANILLDGIYTEDLRRPVTDETGIIEADRRPTYPVRGTVLLDGCPVPSAMVVFYHVGSGKKLTRAGDGLTEADGSFVMSTYTAFDGAAAGEYVVTVTRYQPPVGPSKTPALPALYTMSNTSPLKARIEKAENRLTFELKSDAKPPIEEKKPKEKVGAP
jgi:serine/threonine-protein phosphatase CPPED1